MKYLFDSNTLIEAKNRYYHMDICPGFWEWIIQENSENRIASIEMVRNELMEGNDALKDWVEDQKQLFIPESDAPTQTVFAQVAGLVMKTAPSMKNGAAEDFLAGADPWLIAKAKTLDAVLVTQEHFDPNNKKKFLIPNLCRELGVTTINTFELLLAMEAQFVLATKPGN